MTRARIVDRHHAGEPLELVNLTDNAEWVLRDESGDVQLFENSEVEWVEVQCDRCGAYTRHIEPSGDGWTCTASHLRAVGD